MAQYIETLISIQFKLFQVSNLNVKFPPFQIFLGLMFSSKETLYGRHVGLILLYFILEYISRAQPFQSIYGCQEMSCSIQYLGEGKAQDNSGYHFAFYGVVTVTK
jgi:hypothetical protein